MRLTKMIDDLQIRYTCFSSLIYLILKCFLTRTLATNTFLNSLVLKHGSSILDSNSSWTPNLISTVIPLNVAWVTLVLLYLHHMCYTGVSHVDAFVCNARTSALKVGSLVAASSNVMSLFRKNVDKA